MTVAEVPGRSVELTADVLRSTLLADLKLKTVAGENGFSRVIS